MKERSIRMIGYWMESLRDEDYFLPQEFVRPMAESDRTTVAEYLERGEEYEVYRGLSWCRFRCARVMGCREFSDGYWAWPEDLGHYVRDHGVTLPEEFILHVRAGTGRLAKELWNQKEADLTFWKKWCRENSLERYRERIMKAGLWAKAKGEMAFAAAVVERRLKEGLSKEGCLSAGCGELALSGHALCAACSMAGLRVLYIDEPMHDFTKVLGDEDVS